MFKASPRWEPPSNWIRISTIDAHTEGEPFRVVTNGFPELPGATILERRRYAKTHYDHLRKALMWEPRGHADMYGCLVTPPVTADADLGVLFMHNEGFSTMCGHGVIGLAHVALATGMVNGPRIVMDTPAGRVVAEGSGKSVRFRNVPSFVVALDDTVEVGGLGRVRYDLAFGGAFYAFVRASDLGLRCEPQDYRALIEQGMAIKRAVMASREIPHPFEVDLSFLYGTIFTSDTRNVCVFAEGEVDRSPTGTGVSARLAIHHARGEVQTGERMRIESIVGSSFTCWVAEKTTFGPHAAVIPEVEGTAHITGRHEFFIDPDDPFREGFMLR